MLLLRRLPFRRTSAVHIVMDSLLCSTSRALVVTSVFSRFTATRCPSTAIACDGINRSCCCQCWNSIHRHFHVMHRCASLSQNVDNDSLSGKLPTVESDSAPVLSDSLLVKDQPSHTKDILKSKIDSEKTESRIHLDESKRELVVYVDDEFMKTKATELYKLIRKMDSEQVLSLVEHSHHLLDKTHLALCMKRLFTLSTEDSELCAAEVVAQDQRFQVLCAYMARKARYLQPAIVNDVVTFLCHFGLPSSHPAMRVCLQLMMKHSNDLTLDQLATLAHDLSGLDATKQTRLLCEVVAVLCCTRGDQLATLSVEHKIYLLEEFGRRLPYTAELLESLWKERMDVYKWQQAVGFFVALAKAAATADAGDSVRSASPRHKYLEEWCMDILLQQYVWLNVDDIEALLGAFIQLWVYDAELFRNLGNHAQQQTSELESRLVVWNLMADADYMHVGLMNALLNDLKTSEVWEMSVDAQLSLIPFLAEAINYYRGGSSASSEQPSNQCFTGAFTSCVEELSKILQTPETVPADVKLDTCLHWTALHNSPPDQLSSHTLDSCMTEMTRMSFAHELPPVCLSQLDKLVLLANLRCSSDSVHGRVSELAACVGEQSRPRSPLCPALLMSCDNVKHAHTTSLGFYADHLLPSTDSDKQSTAVLCWYESHHFWINTGRLKSIPRLYAETMQRLHSYNVLIVNADNWLSMSERERFMYISTTLNNELHRLTVV